MKKLRKIGPKMLVSLLGTFIAVLGLFLVIVIVRTMSLADTMATDLIENAAENNAMSMSAEFSKADTLAMELSFAAHNFESIEEASRRDYLDGVLKESVENEMTVALGAWFCFEPNALDGMDSEYMNSAYSDSTGRYMSYFAHTSNGVTGVPLTGYDEEGSFYKEPLQSGAAFVTQPYDYEVDGQIVSVITFSYPITNAAGKIVGAAGVDYSLDYMNELNDKVHLYETGAGKLLTDVGTIVAHANLDMIGAIDPDVSTSKEASTIMETLKNGNTYVGKMYSDVLKSNSYKGFAGIPMGNSGTNWIYAVIVPEAEILATTYQMIAIVLGICVVGLIVASAIIILLSNSISKPIAAMCKVAGEIAGGNLAVVIPAKYKKNKDEIGDLSRDLQAMRDGLVETVSGINNATGSLQSQVSNINVALGSLNDRITDTSAAAEELSAGMEETGASAEEMSATAIEIERAVEMVSEKAEEGASRSGEIQSRASDLGRDVNASIQKSNQVFEEIRGSLEKALEDSKAVDEINALADAILDITSQTTLLALNASIEAARAGEAGRGFAVVANEIGALADNSKNTVAQIQQITQIVMNAVNALSKNSGDLLKFVAEDVRGDYNDMLKAADSYTSDAIYVSDMTSDLSATAEELLASVQSMLKAINEVSMAAQDGAKTTTVVAQQTTDISCNASVVVDNMHETQNTSVDLATLVGKFKLEDN